jgi:hypothetical protein
VAKGFTQVKDIDFNKIFSHVAQMESIQVMLIVIKIEDLKVHQMDVKIVFFNGDICAIARVLKGT